MISQRYRVRRLGARRFRVVNPQGNYVENDKGNPSNFATHQQAVNALRLYERGKKKEPHPLLDFEDDFS